MFLPGESQGQGSLVGCRLWGRTESGTTEVTQQQQQQGNKDPICRPTHSKKKKKNRIWIKSLTSFSFVLCLVSLAHGTTAETLHLMSQNKVPSAKWLCPHLSSEDHMQKLHTTLNSEWRQRATCRDAAASTQTWTGSRRAALASRELHPLPTD